MKSLTLAGLKLVCLGALSMLTLAFASGLRAHEVQPTIGDLTVAEGTATLVLRINLEAFLAGVDLDALDDINDAENAADYDALRALSGAEIAARAPQLLSDWNTLPLLAVDGAPVPLASPGVSVPDDIDFEFSRVAEWTLSGPVPRDAMTAILTWPSGSGAMVLRQQGVEDPFTGYLYGGDASPEVVLAEGGVSSVTALGRFWRAVTCFVRTGC